MTKITSQSATETTEVVSVVDRRDLRHQQLSFLEISAKAIRGYHADHKSGVDSTSETVDRLSNARHDGLSRAY